MLVPPQTSPYLDRALNMQGDGFVEGVADGTPISLSRRCRSINRTAHPRVGNLRQMWLI